MFPAQGTIGHVVRMVYTSVVFTSESSVPVIHPLYNVSINVVRKPLHKNNLEEERNILAKMQVPSKSASGVGGLGTCILNTVLKGLHVNIREPSFVFYCL